ncbi:MAG: hypothetical protein FOGNACKC_04048 [Anaerolineae bacterium]|nr:hypothetical protein [Anaerolineae bacterium]
MTNPPESRPTQPAFLPATGKDILGLTALGVLSLAGAAIGLLQWLNPSLLNLDSLYNPSWLAIFLPFIFPLFVPAAFYLWWLAWRDWRRTRVFEQSKVTGAATITHLWVDPPRPPGKKYYVGYQYGQGQSAYQPVPVRTHKRLAVGEQVAVEYVPGRPELSRIDLQKKAPRR